MSRPSGMSETRAPMMEAMHAADRCSIESSVPRGIVNSLSFVATHRQGHRPRPGPGGPSRMKWSAWLLTQERSPRRAAEGRLSRGLSVGAIGIETEATSAPSVANRRENDARDATEGDAKRREV